MSMNLFHTYFPELTADQLWKFEQLQKLYEEWNQRINLISRKDIPFLYERHILHSLSIAKFILFAPNTVVADVGTGGGFPGIPLAIFFPDVKFILIDSITKKIKVVNEIYHRVNLKNITTINSRAEKISLQCDFVVSRAVTGLKEFFNLTKHLIRKESFNTLENGIIYLKGGEFETESNLFPGEVKIINISNYFKEDFFSTKRIVYISTKPHALAYTTRR